TFEVERCGQVFSQVLDQRAELPALYASLFTNRIGDVPYHVAGNRKADTLIASSARRDGRTNADDFAFQVHQRSAAIAGIDGRIGLNEVLVVRNTNATTFGADNSRRDGIEQFERTADRQHPFADFDTFRIA